MRLEVLCFDGCPNCMKTDGILREVLAEEGIEAEVDLVAVDTDEEARRLRFPGSPTIRADGRDLFPSGAGEREDWRLGCRLYATLEGLEGYPTTGMLREALLRAEPARQGSDARGTAKGRTDSDRL